MWRLGLSYIQNDYEYLADRIADEDPEHYGFSYDLDGNEQMWLTKEELLYADGIKIETEWGGGFTTCWAKVGNTVFYRDKGDSQRGCAPSAIWKMDITGENRMLVNNDEPSLMYSIGDEYLYYSENVDGITLYRVRKDGTDWKDLGTLRVALYK